MLQRKLRASGQGPDSWCTYKCAARPTAMLPDKQAAPAARRACRGRMKRRIWRARSRKSRMRLLLINANTSTAMTDKVVAAARLLAPDYMVEGVTGRFGAEVIASRSAYAIAAHAALDRSEAHTSELQSLMRISYAVFCLKKKKVRKTRTKEKY